MSTLSMQAFPLSDAAQQGPDTVVDVGVDQFSSLYDSVVRNIQGSELSGSLLPWRIGDHFVGGDYGPYDDDGENSESS
ncbi:MAG: hypothetical protein JOZ18_05515 [Chloroflexi bacterium]|nr:hypothetical protein [Chloroflexota bacterium]